MSTALLELRQIPVSCDGLLALRDLNLSLQPGELRAVIGPNGAGKTTFLDVITGKTAPLHGVVAISLADEVEMLLHQQHPDPGVGDDPTNSSFNVLNNVGLNTLGGLIQKQQLWLAKQGPGDCQLLLLSPTQIPAFTR